MARSVAFLVTFALALFTASLASRPPAPNAADVAPTVFSATRAMVDVEAIAQRAHPIGSADIIRVRQYLRQRLTALGLEVAPDIEQQALFVPTRVARTLVTGRVHNVQATLKGISPGLPALLLMSHYDTVPNSPGAADDTAGVAATLEIIANLKAAGPLKRDVIILFTEGEEAGLLGSRAFFTESPDAKRVGLVLNLETRGGSGRALMFETSSHAGGLVDTYGSVVGSPAANSLSAFVYHNMPNGTDLTNALTAGIPGMNFAFIADEYAYHTASATPDRLNRGSLQHLGDQVLALTQKLGNADDLRATAPDITYSDLFGLGFISYPQSAGWAFIGLLAVLIGFALMKARALGLVAPLDVAHGMGFFLALVLAQASALYLAGQLLGGMSDVQAKYTLLSRFDFFLGGCIAIAFALALFVAATFVRSDKRLFTALAALAIIPTLLGLLAGRADPVALVLLSTFVLFSALTIRRRLMLWGGWLGGLALLFIAAIALQTVAPGTTNFLVWPLLPLALAAVLALFLAQGNLDRRLSLIIVAPLTFISVAFIATSGTAIFLGLGGILPLVLALPALLAAIALYPGLDALGRMSRAPEIAVAVAIIGAASLGWAAHGPASAAHPRVTQAFYLAGPEPDQFARISMLRSLDTWSRAALTADGGTPERAILTPGYPQPAWRATAKPAAVARPTVSADAVSIAGGKRITLKITPAGKPRELRFVMQADTAITDVAMDGRPTALAPRPGEWSQFLVAAPPAKATSLSFTAKAKGAVSLRVFEVTDGWPEGVAVPAKPEGFTPFQMSDTTYAASALDFRWPGP